MRQKPQGALDALLKQEQDYKGASVLPTAATPRPAGALPPQQIYPSKGPGQVPPESCIPWAYADRGEFEFDHVDELAESMKVDGQLQPAIVRPLIQRDASTPVRYEIIAGRARWKSASKAGKKLDVVVRSLNDEEAFRVMVQENERRRDISDYSKGLRFKHALDTGLYESASQLSTTFKISNATVSRLLATAALDPRIVAAFSSPAAISNRLGAMLKTAFEAGFIEQIVRDAKRIEQGLIRQDQIPGIWGEGGAAPVRVAPPVAEKNAQRASTKRYVSAKGLPLFTVKERGDRHAVVKFQVAVDESVFEKLRTALDKKTNRRARETVRFSGGKS